MTVATLPASTLEQPRPGSRAARLAMPRAVDVMKQLAMEHGVCIRPVSLRRTDLGTGQTEVIDVPCGATRDDKCPPCAKRAKRLRQAQIREGWHRTDEPNPGPEPATEEQRALIVLRAHLEYGRADAERTGRFDLVADADEAIAEVEAAIAVAGMRGSVAPPHTPEDGPAPAKKKRSTRRRQDVPDLPRQKVQARTVGRTYTAPDGTVHQPSMWLTLTLDSYGPIHAAGRPCPCRRTHGDDDPVAGTPVNPAGYDYRRAAWDAVHFPRLLDRYWQNLRRCIGWNVQYAGCVEPQRRLAPHAHFAIRGTIPRATLEQVAAATYHQVWWPAADQPRYTPDAPPTWNGENWTDPATGEPLPTWDQALAAIDDDPDAEPVHVARLGPQVKAKGVDPGSKDVDRTIGYITKYVTKASADCHAAGSDPQRAHLDRLWHALRFTPCTDRCSNWLLYGVQPKKATGKLRPGHCKGKVHQKATLGIGGRRVLVSRDWSGKTLADHRADSRAWVRALLGVTVGHDQAGEVDASAGDTAPVAWELARPDDPDVPPLQHRLLRAVSTRIQQRAQVAAAVRQRDGTDPPAQLSATEWHAAALRGTGGRTSIAQSYRFLRAVMNGAVREGAVPRNPCQIKGAGSDRAKERPVATPVQVAELVTAITPRYRAAVLLGAWCGLRRGEVVGLRLVDVDLAAGTVTVRRNRVELDNGEALDADPKTEAGKRTIVIPPHVLPVLREHVKTWAGDDRVFVGRDGHVMRGNAISQAFVRARARVGMDGFTFHDLRHTGQTLAASTGATLKDLMKRLGHASTAAAYRYMHAVDGRDAEIAAALSKLAAEGTAAKLPSTADGSR